MLCVHCGLSVESFWLSLSQYWVQSEAILVGIPNTIARPWQLSHDPNQKEFEDPILLVRLHQDQLQIKTQPHAPTFCSHGQHVQSDDPSHVLDAQKTEFAVSGKVHPQKLLVDVLAAHLLRQQRLPVDSACAHVEHHGNGSIAGESCARARQLILSALVPSSTRTSDAFAANGYLPFGAITARGWDRVHPNTENRSGILAAVHELARHGKNQHAYLSAAVVRGGHLEVAQGKESKRLLDDKVCCDLLVSVGVGYLTEWQHAARHCQLLTQNELGADLCFPVLDLPPVPEDTELTDEQIESSEGPEDSQEQHMQETIQHRALAKRLPNSITIQEPTPAQRQAVHRAHVIHDVNLGHPRQAEFLRALKLAGVELQLRLWAKHHYKCGACESSRL
eukprot:4214571-Amphidinium_carterae.1